MPHAMLRLVGGVNTTETPAFNENAGISSSNLIRYQYDQNGSPLVQKLGGWTKFFPTAMVAIVRALWAWEDINSNAWLAVGTQNIFPTPPGQDPKAQLAVIKAGVLTDITPTRAGEVFGAGFPALASTTSGSPSVLIQSPGVSGINNTCSVYIATQIAVGGLVLFGAYPCDPDGFLASNSFTVFSRDILGNILPATSTSSAYVLPSFTTTAGSRIVTVTFPNTGQYTAGVTFPILLPTNVGGLTLYGNYIIQNGGLASFTILTATAATSSATAFLNFNEALYLVNGLSASVFAPLTPALDWTLDNFGEDLIACPIQPPSVLNVPYQPIYLWSPSGQQTTAQVIPGAPPVNDGIFVAMPQRQIVAWGSTEDGIQDPLLINWCDVNNFNQWIALVTNQAGSYRIPKGSRIVGCVQGPQQALVWTDVDVWSMQYIGPPFVYSFNEIGSGCGLIARKAAISMRGVYYWMGPSQFYTLGGEGVLPLPCPVWDVVFQNLNQTPLALSRMRVAVNSRFDEIQWFYQSATGGDVDSYVKYNVALGEWDYGSLSRTAWVDQSVLGPPIGSEPISRLLYQHETSNDADGVAMQPFFQTGYFSLNEGDFKTFIDWVWPDMKWSMFDQSVSATIAISFLVADYPGDTPKLFGPYNVTRATQYFNTRLRGRLVSVRISSSDLGTWWRIGALRYRWAADGKI